jgi:hypothetical protein
MHGASCHHSTEALAKAGEELGGSVGSRGIEPKDALLYMAKALLESNPENGGHVRVPRDESIYTILYRVCPDCRKAHVLTPEGLVEVATEVVERVEGEAAKTAIAPEEEDRVDVPVTAEERDRPNTPALVRKVLLRDGRKCANPMCRCTLGLHAHHLQLRSRGGRTALFNEAALCPACHSAAHLGLLRIEGDPLTGLKWTPRCAELKLDLGEDIATLLTTPDVRVVEAVATERDATPTDAERGTRADESATADFLSAKAETLEPLGRALVDFGCTKSDAARRLEAAWRIFAGRAAPPTEAELLYQAFRA